MQVFKSSRFILTKGVISQVNRVDTQVFFMEMRLRLIVRRAKVAWTSVCLPKKEGGLGAKIMKWISRKCLNICGFASIVAALPGPVIWDKVYWFLLAFSRRWNVFFVRRVRRILTIFCYPLSKSICYDLWNTCNIPSRHVGTWWMQILSLHCSQKYNDCHIVWFMSQGKW